MLEQLTVDDLRQRLQEKEHTVATLTEYLEQAAAKLKNLQKEGAGKSARAFDVEEVERQMALVKQLQAAVEEWQQLRAPETLDRIGTQLDDLRQTILRGLTRQSGGPAESGYESSGLTSGLTFTMPEREGSKPSGSALEGWEALKAEMLKAEVDPAKEEEENGHIDLKEELEVLVNRPAPVDPICDDRTVWQEAVDCREKYMISLIRALRVVENRRRGNPDWESFTEAPAELRAEVAQLASELQQSLRNAEVEQSIERARISRQESLIAQHRREIDKARKKGFPQKSSGNGDPQGRWLKFLGKNQAGEE